MRKVLILLAAAVTLSGCAAILTEAVEERAEQQCHEENRRAPDHLEC